jgi:delta 1-pyrroline-5-carboxylate dehydrogenase
VVEPGGSPARYPVWRLQAERSVSVNTVAAGGNASLLAQMD